MWTLDNNIKSIISKSKSLLNDDKNDEFLKLQKEIIEMIRDIIVKENKFGLTPDTNIRALVINILI